MRSIIMLNVKEDIEVTININEKAISVKDKNNNQLFFKEIKMKDNKEINHIVVDMLNKHYQQGYVITAMDIF